MEEVAVVVAADQVVVVIVQEEVVEVALVAADQEVIIVQEDTAVITVPTLVLEVAAGVVMAGACGLFPTIGGPTTTISGFPVAT
jgi:hypothetical protein